ncbi:PapD-like protein [Epithele typhae]|uniref:PapD-like protein n=1 Tax=Epithele typhae TaxID=378194 RepID=UPI0020074D87|nr:PapD-like protein [Epithele typhae]KAH9912679.1 PapD-like protein [Epithele typhae]
MSVSLNPSSVLGFNRAPFTQSVKRALQITNNNTQPVAFKVKTTAPKLYCVRPNSGRVEPGETVEVAVMLQAMKEDLPTNAKCKDKFLIQSTVISPDKEAMSLQEMWNVEGDEVHSQKIRVVYLPPEGQTVPEEDESHANMSSLLSVPGQDVSPSPLLPYLAPAPLASSPAPRSATQNYATVRQNPYTNGHANGEETEHAHAQPEIHHDAPSTPPEPPHVTVSPPEVPAAPAFEEVIVLVHVPPPAPSPPAPAPAPAPVLREIPAPAPAPAPVPAPAPAPIVREVIVDPNPKLVKKLEDAHHEIERLRQLIASMPEPSVAPTSVTGASEMRHRSRRGGGTTAAMSDDGSEGTYDGRSEYDGRTEVGSYVGSEIAAPDGVPLQVVIIIALGVFVTTYLFF